MGNFSTYLNVYQKCSFGDFRSQISKCPIYTILQTTSVNIELSSQSTKEMKKSSSSERTCTY